MTATNLVSKARVNTGPWEAYRRVGRVRCPHRRNAPGESGDPVRLYYLVDGRGHRLGVITAPTRRPQVGPDAPTVYLRRM